jgi:hypothetical protein
MIADSKIPDLIACHSGIPSGDSSENFSLQQPTDSSQSFRPTKSSVHPIPIDDALTHRNSKANLQIVDTIHSEGCRVLSPKELLNHCCKRNAKKLTVCVGRKGKRNLRRFSTHLVVPGKVFPSSRAMHSGIRTECIPNNK